MTYNLSSKNYNLDSHSPIRFKKSPSKVGYYTTTKDQQIQDLKQKYGIGKNYKPKEQKNFTEIRKLPQQFANLRQTFNINSTKSPRENIEQPSIKDFLRKTTYTKPDINLRHTVYSTKPTSDDNNYPYNSNTGFTSSFRKGSDYMDNNNYQIKVNQAKEVKPNNDKSPKIDYQKINQKIQNNAKMIDELKRLKDQRKNLKQTKTLLKSQVKQSLNVNETPIAKAFSDSKAQQRKKLNAKSYQVQALTPKYQKKDNQDKFMNVKNGLQKSKSTYLNPQRVKSTITNKVTINDFVLGKNLGEGKFGTVYLSIHKSTGSIFAIKKVPKAMIKSHLLIDQFILELKLQSYFQHRNILKIYGFFDDLESIYLILEYMEQGTLFSYLKKNKTLSQKDAAKKIKQVTEAVDCLHQQGVAHRDIKPQNIVMSNDVCKLCDFGWATICNQRRKTYCGTFDYAAPQILQGIQYDMSVDLWCIGILAYQLMVGKAPFYHISRKQTMKKILSVDQNAIQYPQTMSKNAISFIDKLIIKNPDQRMKSDQAIKHPFLQIDQFETL